MRLSFPAALDPASPEDIATAERALGVGLPSDYCAFLQEHNGGRPQPNQVDGNPMVGVTVLFGVNAADPELDLVGRNLDLRGRLPDGLLAVADAAGGNLVCLSTSGVYFWDHEYEGEEDEPPSLDTLTFLSPTFRDFLESLRPDDDADEQQLPQVVSSWIDPDFLAEQKRLGNA